MAPIAHENSKAAQNWPKNFALMRLNEGIGGGVARGQGACLGGVSI